MSAIVVWGLGCTAAPVAGELVLEQREVPARAGMIAIPDAARPAAPVQPLPASAEAPALPPTMPGVLPPEDAGPPRLWLARSEQDCSIEVRTAGFPAVAIGGDHFVAVQRDDGGNADFEGPTTVELRDRDGGSLESLAVFDEMAVFGDVDEASVARTCRRERAAVRARIAAINERLATGFRPLRRVPVQFPWRLAGAPALPELDADPHQRPLEALYRGGRFVTRVRGVRVVQSTPVTGWRRGDPEQTLDSVVPTVLALYHDDATGLGLAALSYESASCMSDSNTYLRVVELTDATLRAAAERSRWLVADAGDQDAAG
ncbi:MAG: hypothetical protein K1X88_01635 [Nannocystaceae bacterium]|nr:hypothetical protein [Nannocystaceae bacterium]